MRVADCFRRQISVPLLNLEDTYVELQVWIRNSEIPAGIMNETAIEYAYKNSRKQLETYRPHENNLLVQEDRAATYQNYIKDVKQPTHVICLYERAVAELSLNSELWLQYCNYLRNHNMSTSEVAGRATRNCPWNESLWVFQIRQMEFQAKAFDQITLKLEAGLEAILPTRGLELWLSYLEYSYRNDTLTIDQLNQIFEQAQKHLGSTADPSSTVPRYHARILAKREDLPGARRIWTLDILKQPQNRAAANAWLEYITLERMQGTTEEVRRAYEKALAAVKDWPQSIAEDWIMFERESGTLESTLHCVEKCCAIPKTETPMEIEESAINGNKRKQEGEHRFDKRKRDHHPHKMREEGKFASLTKQPEPTRPQLDVHSLDPDRTVFISNISSLVTEDRLRATFPNASQVDLMRDVKGKSRGHGYVQFTTPPETSDALKRDREPLDGRPLFISRFKPAREERQHAFSTEKEENKLFVKGLPHSITQEHLESLFRRYGASVKVRLVLQRSGRPKGLAYVEYATKEEAAAALKATDGMTLDDCMLSVAISAPPRKAAGSSSSATEGGEFWRRERSMPFKSRLQVPLIPRVLSARSAVAASSSATDGNATTTKEPPKTNQDFRNMLLQGRK